jgi:hypothetical protein
MAALAPPRSRISPLWWERLPVEELLDVRLCDLGLRVAGSPLEPRVRRLYDELAGAGLRFRPSVWLSTDWFSPVGVPGFAIPFYLAHPRLVRLERAQMHQAEGSNQGWCMKLLRHETGHAIDTAHRLHWTRNWRQHFGRVSAHYASTYIPDPVSQEFVHHLYNYYAQSHPVEDFAETFAVWLRPGGHWRRRYADAPSLKKILFVDQIMREIGDRPPKVRSRERTDSLPRLRLTLREYYLRKKEHYGEEDHSVYDRDLLRLFTGDPEARRRPAASAFLRERRNELRQVVTQWTGQHRFVVDDVLSGMIQRCRELGLRLVYDDPATGEGAAVLLTLHTSRIQRMRHREYFR